MEEKNTILVKKVIAIICGIVIILTGIYLYYSYNHKFNGDFQTAGYCERTYSTSLINQENSYMLISSYLEYTALLEKANSYGWHDIGSMSSF